MYNQSNHGPQPRMPMLPAYKQRPLVPPPHHFQQGPTALPPPPPLVQQVSSLAQPSNGAPPPSLPPPPISHQGSSFQIPTNVTQSAGRSYGNGALFRNAPQHSQRSLHFGVQDHVPLPPQGHPPHSEMSRASAQGLNQLPHLPGGAQSMQHALKIPMASSGFPTPPPPPPPVSTLSNTAQLSDSELKPCCEDMNLDGGSTRASSVTGGVLLSTSNVMSDFPSPPPKPIEERTIQNIEAMCKLIAQDGPDIEDKARQNESKNPEFEFLFGGDPGTEPAIAHEYFMWMKKKCILEHRLNEVKNDNLSRYQTVDSSKHHDSDKFSSNTAADSDMEMEDDFTPLEKDQMLNDSGHSLDVGHPQFSDELNTSNQLYGTPKSAEDIPVVDIPSGNESFPQFTGLGKKNEGIKVLSSGCHVIPARSPTKVACAIEDSAESFMSSELEKSVSPLAHNISQYGSADCANAIKTHVPHGHIMKGSSPVRLLEGYASDDHSNNGATGKKNISVSTVSPLLAKDSQACYLEDADPKSLLMTGKCTGFTSHIYQSAYKTSSDGLKEVKDSSIKLGLQRTTKEHSNHNIENQGSADGATLSEACEQKDGFSNAGIATDQHIGKARQENEEKMSKLESTVKVDEFGRLVREGHVDSDSDDDMQHPQTRRPRKREHSRSWSRSPVGRRRRRRWRSPLRRKEKRSLSRSLSPWNRRKRSRSPLSRHSREFGGDNIRRNRIQNQDCFDFLRGRCHRGASCRYAHHETDKSSVSRSLGERHGLEAPSTSRNSQIHEEPKESSSRVLVSVRDKHGSQEADFARDHSMDNAMQRSIMDHASRSGHVAILEVKSCREIDAYALKHQFREKLEEHTHFHNNGSLLKSGELSCVSVGGLENSNRQSQMKDKSALSSLSPDKRSMASPSKLLTVEILPNITPSSQPQHATRFSNQGFSLEPPMHSQSSNNLAPSSRMDMAVNPQHLPPALAFPVQKGGNSVQVPPVSSDYGPMPQAAMFRYQSARRESYQPCQVSLPNQYNQFSVPSNNAWTSFPPPPKRSPYGPNLDSGKAASYSSSQYYQSSLQPRDDQLGPSKSSSQMEASTPKSLPLDNSANKPHSVQESHSASSLSVGAVDSQSKHFSWEPASDKLHPSSASVLPEETVLRSCSPAHPYSRMQPAQQSLQYFAAAEGTQRLHGDAICRFRPDPIDQSQPAHFLNSGGSRSSSYHNPFAPVFEQTLGSKSISNFLSQNMDNRNTNKCNTSIISHIPVKDEGASCGRSRPTTSPKSAQFAALTFPRSGSNQYDPLFDSIEPSNFISKDNPIQNQEIIGDSDIIAKTRSTCKVLHTEDEHREDGAGAVASTSSLNNDEYGETADEEVADIESESPSTHGDVANTTTGEVEIDQVKSASKRKTKDSRSMKLFKIAVANFVKEVLKPSWRQGNMSKVAFKTIVKKTVDKVSGSMKGHHIPKSQEKIDRYIDSSQQKLTKLVMGYVDKYVKV